MEQVTLILTYIPLLAFNFFAWYVLWEEGSRMFDSKNFNLAAVAFFLTNIIMSKLNNKVIGDIHNPSAIAVMIVLSIIYIYAAYLGHKKGKIKYRTSEEV